MSTVFDQFYLLVRKIRGLSTHAADAEGGASRQNEEGNQDHEHNDTGF